MRTIVIWDQLDAAIKFFILEGDYSRFDNTYISECSSDLQDELTDIVYRYEPDYAVLVEMLESFPEHQDGDIVIVAGDFL